MRLQPLPNDPAELRKLLDESKAFLEYYSPVIFDYLAFREECGIDPALDQARYERLVEKTEICENGPGFLSFSSFLEHPFDWTPQEEPGQPGQTFPEVLARWLASLNAHPDAPWYGKLVLADLVFDLRIEILRKLDSVREAILRRDAEATPHPYSFPLSRHFLASFSERTGEAIQAGRRWQRRRNADSPDEEAIGHAAARFAGVVAIAVAEFANPILDSLVESLDWADFAAEDPDLARATMGLARRFRELRDGLQAHLDWSFLDRLAETHDAYRAALNPEAKKDWIYGTRKALTAALGKSDNYSDYLERKAAEGLIELKKPGRRGGQFAIIHRDPLEHERIRGEIREDR